MNMISFYPEFLDYIDVKMNNFLQTADLAKDEYLIPDVIQQAINEGITIAHVIDTKAKWVGVTYKEDKESVISYIESQVKNNQYPHDLWS